MGIEVTCDGCGRTMKAKDEAAGRRANCPDCGAIVEIPFGSDKPIFDAVEEPAWDARSPEASAAAPDSGDSRPRVPCPSCAEMIIEGAAKCRFCGSHFSDQGRGPWQDGHRLVFRKDVPLPLMCVKSNAPCQRTLTRKLMWHPAPLYIVLLLGPIPYAIVALIVSKRATVELPLTDHWFSRRLQAILIAWGTIVISGIMFCSGVIMVDSKPGGGPLSPLMIIGAILLALSAAIFGMVRARLVSPTRITDTHVWLKGANRDYLSDLPSWDSRLD